MIMCLGGSLKYSIHIYMDGHRIKLYKYSDLEEALAKVIELSKRHCTAEMECWEGDSLFLTRVFVLGQEQND